MYILCAMLAFDLTLMCCHLSYHMYVLCAVLAFDLTLMCNVEASFHLSVYYCIRGEDTVGE